MRGVNDDELADLVRYGADHGAEVRFIEYMDVGRATGWDPRHVVSSDEILSRLTADGRWYRCLYAATGTDLRSLRRQGQRRAALSRLIADRWRERDHRGAVDRPVCEPPDRRARRHPPT